MIHTIQTTKEEHDQISMGEMKSDVLLNLGRNLQRGDMVKFVYIPEEENERLMLLAKITHVTNKHQKHDHVIFSFYLLEGVYDKGENIIESEK